jgi:hypothetical protein
MKGSTIKYEIDLVNLIYRSIKIKIITWVSILLAGIFSSSVIATTTTKFKAFPPISQIPVIPVYKEVLELPDMVFRVIQNMVGKYSATNLDNVLFIFEKDTNRVNVISSGLTGQLEIETAINTGCIGEGGGWPILGTRNTAGQVAITLGNTMMVKLGENPDNLSDVTNLANKIAAEPPLSELSVLEGPDDVQTKIAQMYLKSLSLYIDFAFKTARGTCHNMYTADEHHVAGEENLSYTSSARGNQIAQKFLAILQSFPKIAQIFHKVLQVIEYKSYNRAREEIHVTLGSHDITPEEVEEACHYIRNSLHTEVVYQVDRQVLKSITAGAAPFLIYSIKDPCNGCIQQDWIHQPEAIFLYQVHDLQQRYRLDAGYRYQLRYTASAERKESLTRPIGEVLPTPRAPEDSIATVKAKELERKTKSSK